MTSGSISSIYLPDFRYARPTTLEELFKLMNANEGQYSIMAGGTDLLPELRNKLKNPKLILDIKAIDEFRGITVNDNSVIIGSVEPLSNILKNPAIKKSFNSLWLAIQDLSDSIIRKRATLGGNICNASPAADSAGPLLVHQAELTIVSSDGSYRNVHIADFFTGVKKNSLQKNELLVKIKLPVKDGKSSFVKVKRKSEDLAVAAVAANLYEDESGRHLFVGCTAVGPVPILVDLTMALSKEDSLSKKELIKRLSEAILSKIRPISDVRASEEYRRHMINVLSRQVLAEVLK